MGNNIINNTAQFKAITLNYNTKKKKQKQTLHTKYVYECDYSGKQNMLRKPTTTKRMRMRDGIIRHTQNEPTTNNGSRYARYLITF